MRIVSVSLVRNEADIIEAFVRYHCECVVDHMVIVDHDSTDETRDILLQLQKEGLPLTIDHLHEFGHAQGAALLGAIQKRALPLQPDWIMLLDADEFLCAADPLETVREVIGTLSGDAVCRIVPYTYVERLEDDHEEADLFRRIQYRRTLESDHFSRILLPYSVAGRQDIVLAPGNHGVHLAGGGPLDVRDTIVRSLQVAHFPFRSVPQMMQKILSAWPRNVAEHTKDTQYAFHWKQLFDRIIEKHMLDENDLFDAAFGYPMAELPSEKQSLEKKPFAYPSHLNALTHWRHTAQKSALAVLSEEHLRIADALAHVTKAG